MENNITTVEPYRRLMGGVDLTDLKTIEAYIYKPSRRFFDEKVVKLAEMLILSRC